MSCKDWNLVMLLPESTESLERRQLKNLYMSLLLMCLKGSWANQERNCEFFLELLNKVQIRFFSRKAKIYYIYNTQ